MSAIGGAATGATVGLVCTGLLIRYAGVWLVIGGAVVLGVGWVTANWSKSGPRKRAAWGLAGATLGGALCSIPLILRDMLGMEGGMLVGAVLGMFVGSVVGAVTGTAPPGREAPEQIASPDRPRN